MTYTRENGLAIKLPDTGSTPLLRVNVMKLTSRIASFPDTGHSIGLTGIDTRESG